MDPRELARKSAEARRRKREESAGEDDESVVVDYSTLARDTLVDLLDSTSKTARTQAAKVLLDRYGKPSARATPETINAAARPEWTSLTDLVEYTLNGLPEAGGADMLLNDSENGAQLRESVRKAYKRMLTQEPPIRELQESAERFESTAKDAATRRRSSSS